MAVTDFLGGALVWGGFHGVEIKRPVVMAGLDPTIGV
jgi:hypothetical protein